MSSTKRRRICTSDGTTVESPPPCIPVDLLLEIIARSDARTLVRCAATSKPIRRAILDRDFHRRLAPRAEANDGGRFDPALLLGISYVFEDWGCSRPLIVSQEQRHHLLCFDTNRRLSTWYPVGSRGCLVVLHERNTASAKLRVVNTISGQVTRLHSPGVAAKYPRVLLTVGHAGSSFRLLVAGRNLRTRIFSSERGRWGDIVDAHLPPCFFQTPPNYGSSPLVLGGTTVHWLCKERGIVALDVTTARATVIQLPPKCFSQVRCTKGVDKGLLASSSDGRLSLLVAELWVISMWSLSAAADASAARWSRQVVIDRQSIGREGPGYAARFLGFGERSGIVILQMPGVGLVQINLGSREALVLSHEFKEICDSARFRMCLHETEVATLIKNMKRF